jgi:DNA-binding response OmpR family regulator
MASVLVIEDHPDLAHSLGELLRLYGHSVRVALDGEEGLAECEENLPDVVILDIGLPTIDGVQVAQELRSRYGPSLKLIACTALDDGRTRLRMIRAGFDALLVKPAPVDEILDAISGARVGYRSASRGTAPGVGTSAS